MIIFRGDKSRISFCDSRNKNRRGFLNVLILNQNYQVWLVVHISISIVVALIHFFINLIFKSRLENRDTKYTIQIKGSYQQMQIL